MSYQVFALRWRPQRFADVVGQEHVTRPLRNLIREGRIPHAFLLTGARGVGKTTTARILAKALVCERGPAEEPCNECRQCRDVTAGSSMDVAELDAASNRGIDDVRELRENVGYAPASARYRIYIVDEVHMLTREAFNAFLKTLEEPPPHVKFIFATTDVHRVPVTIQSRCQRYDFRLLGRGEILEQLARIAAAEGVAVSRQALAAIAGAGEGSLRDAESLFEQVVAYCGRSIPDAEVAAALGLPEEGALIDFCGDLLGRRGAECLRALDRVCGAGTDPRVFARETLAVLRHLAVLRTDPALEDVVAASPEGVARLRELASGASPGRLQSLFEIFLRVESEIRFTSFPRMLLELAVIRAVRLEEVGEIRGLVERLEGLETRLGPAGPGTAPSAAPRAAGPPAPGAPSRPAGPPPATATDPEPPGTPPDDVAPTDHTPTEPAGLWERFLDRVRAEKAMLAGFLEHGRGRQAGDGAIEIAFPAREAFSLETAREASNLAFLRAAAREVLGGGADVRLVEDAGAEPEEAPPRETDLRKRLRGEALESEALQWAVELFRGQVVEVKLAQ